MKLRSMIALMTATALFAAGPVVANEAAAEMPMHQMKTDANGDSKISYDEFRAAGEQRAERHFKRVDANGDGFIDQTEKKTAFNKTHKHGSCHNNSESGQPG